MGRDALLDTLLVALDIANAMNDGGSGVENCPSL